MKTNTTKTLEYIPTYIGKSIYRSVEGHLYAYLNQGILADMEFCNPTSHLYKKFFQKEIRPLFKKGKYKEADKRLERNYKCIHFLSLPERKDFLKRDLERLKDYLIKS
jgi:hypothetical protein